MSDVSPGPSNAKPVLFLSSNAHDSLEGLSMADNHHQSLKKISLVVMKPEILGDEHLISFSAGDCFIE